MPCQTSAYQVKIAAAVCTHVQDPRSISPHDVLQHPCLLSVIVTERGCSCHRRSFTPGSDVHETRIDTLVSLIKRLGFRASRILQN